MLYTLRFATELRDPRDYAVDTGTNKADAAQLSLAKQLIDAYTLPFEVSKFKDHYEEALRDLVEAKMKNLPAPAPEVEKKSPKVVDLMEALRKSLAQAAPAGQETAEPRSAGDKTSGSREKPAATGAAKAKTSAVLTRAARKTKSA